MTRKPRILVADDSKDIRILLSSYLTKGGWEVVQAEDGEAALKLWQSGSFDVLSTDLNMPHMDGMELTSKVLALDSNAMIFMFSGDNADKAASFIQLGGHAFFDKLEPSIYIRTLVNLGKSFQTEPELARVA